MTTALEMEQESFSKSTYGFWVYLMTDCLLFGSLFATYAVLHDHTFGGPAAKDLFSLPFAFAETMVLLLSSFTCGPALLAAEQGKKKLVAFWFAITFLLGLTFLGMELHEFARFVNDGNSWRRSAFLSAFFTLVGTHGFHISIGLLWMVAQMVQVLRWGITPLTYKRLSLLRMFWHFLDVVWIFIFTGVYLMGIK